MVVLPMFARARVALEPQTHEAEVPHIVGPPLLVRIDVTLSFERVIRKVDDRLAGHSSKNAYAS